MELQQALEKARNGDEDAFAFIFEMFSGKIYKYISYKINEPDQAQDLLQEVFFKAWKGLPKLNLQNLNFNAWLYKIASNTVNDFFRKIYRSPQTVELDENIAGSIFTDKPGYTGNAAIISRALDQLPPQYKELLILRFEQDLDTETTAAALGKTNLSVRVAQHRALSQLRNILKKYDI